MKKEERYTFYDGPLGKCVVEFYRRDAYVHVDLKRRSASALREALRMFPRLVTILRNVGSRRIRAYNLEPDGMWFKFVALLGFIEVGRNGKYVFMELPNVSR